MFITTDHGRGDGDFPNSMWTSHGISVEGCEDIWLGILGPNLNKGIIEAKSTEILNAHQRLVDNLTGSKRSGTTGELFLEHLFKNSGLVYEKQWVKNKSIEKICKYIILN